jgi:hypothetical protein
MMMALDFSAQTEPTNPLTIIIQKLQVLNAYLTGNGPWTAWFGAPTLRSLVIAVRNSDSPAGDDRG